MMDPDCERGEHSRDPVTPGKILALEEGHFPYQLT